MQNIDPEIVSKYLKACEMLEKYNYEVFVDSAEFAVVDNNRRTVAITTNSVEHLLGFAYGIVEGK